jgi:hypothetical protein
MTTNRLTAIAGLCAAAAGAIFIGVQINHPPLDVAHIVTTEMALREAAKALMAVLALIGITGMFLRHQHRLGLLGRIGGLLLAVGYLGMFVVESIGAAVLPTVARTSPTYVQNVLDAAVGHAPKGDIGGMQAVLTVMGIGYALGGLLFGIALFRARVLSRWASVLLAYGTVSALALKFLPDSFNRPFAIPTGVALIGLGISLFREQRYTETAVTGHVVDAPTIQVVAR